MIVEGEGLKMEKMVKLEHHLDALELCGMELEVCICGMQNVPPSFFFVLQLRFILPVLKTNKAELKHMVALGKWGSRQMYGSSFRCWI